MVIANIGMSNTIWNLLTSTIQLLEVCKSTFARLSVGLIRDVGITPFNVPYWYYFYSAFSISF